MFLDIFTHEYFWLSFLPIAVMGGGFWLILFDRADTIKEPLGILSLALLAGILSVFCWIPIGTSLSVESLLGNVAGEEFFKILWAVAFMEIFKKRFKSVSQGIMYGFAVGLGFAVAENVLYLWKVFEESSFDSPEFWLTFQGRFWMSSLLHAVTTGIFGLFYAGAYLSMTVHKSQKESPWKVFFVLPSGKQFLHIITFHVAREHLLFQFQKTLTGHFARAVLLEGFFLAILVHLVFNLCLKYTITTVPFVLSMGGMILLWNVSRKI
jgi:RsiW-degrading membrane proteinase PrsW (M82 family)